MKDHNEMYQSLLSRYNEIREKRNRRIRTIRRTVPVLASFCLSVVLGIGYWSNNKNLPNISDQNYKIEEPTFETTDNITATTAYIITSTRSDEHTESAASTVPVQSPGTECIVHTENNSEVPAEEDPPPDNHQHDGEATQPSQRPTSTVSERTLMPKQTTIDPSSSSSPPVPESYRIPDLTEEVPEIMPEKPMGVLTDISVSYDEAKERFSQDLVECTDSSFIGYKAGIVSQNGNISSDNAFCLQITYEYTNGIVSIIDQDRMIGCSRAADGPKQYDYLDRTFIDETFPNDEKITIGYYPEGDHGSAYVAVFDRSADIYEIMDMIISIEIKK